MANTLVGTRPLAWHGRGSPFSRRKKKRPALFFFLHPGFLVLVPCRKSATEKKNGRFAAGCEVYAKKKTPVARPERPMEKLGSRKIFLICEIAARAWGTYGSGGWAAGLPRAPPRVVALAVSARPSFNKTKKVGDLVWGGPWHKDILDFVMGRWIWLGRVK